MAQALFMTIASLPLCFHRAGKYPGFLVVGPDKAAEIRSKSLQPTTGRDRIDWKQLPGLKLASAGLGLERFRHQGSWEASGKPVLLPAVP